MGVYDWADLYCPQCKEKTRHQTGWESEQPDLLETKCLKCGKQTISGQSFSVNLWPKEAK